MWRGQYKLRPPKALCRHGFAELPKLFHCLPPALEPTAKSQDWWGWSLHSPCHLWFQVPFSGSQTCSRSHVSGEATQLDAPVISRDCAFHSLYLSLQLLGPAKSCHLSSSSPHIPPHFAHSATSSGGANVHLRSSFFELVKVIEGQNERKHFEVRWTYSLHHPAVILQNALKPSGDGHFLFHQVLEVSENAQKVAGHFKAKLPWGSHPSSTSPPSRLFHHHPTSLPANVAASRTSPGAKKLSNSPSPGVREEKTDLFLTQLDMFTIKVS